MMNKKILISTLLFGLLSPLATVANDKVATVYHPEGFQKVCQGKQVGEWVQFAYRGIIWNGSCQNQFFSNDKKAQIYGDEPELLSVCAKNPKADRITLEERTYMGKCALGFTPPRPAAGNR